MTKIRSILALSLVLAGAARAQTKPVPVSLANPAAPTTVTKPTPAATTAPTVYAPELETLRITNAVQDLQLNQAAIKDAQAQTEPMRQKLIQAITQAAYELKLTPDYQWDFQQKMFVRQQMAPAAAPAQADKK